MTTRVYKRTVLEFNRNIIIISDIAVQKGRNGHFRVFFHRKNMVHGSH